MVGLSGPGGQRGLYGISVAAELVGMGVQKLRSYEARGLLEPDRSEGGTRRYSADDLERLRRIGDLLDAGLNLAGIGMVLDLEARTANCERNRRSRPAGRRPPRASRPARRATLSERAHADSLSTDNVLAVVPRAGGSTRQISFRPRVLARLPPLRQPNTIIGDVTIRPPSPTRSRATNTQRPRTASVHTRPEPPSESIVASAEWSRRRRDRTSSRRSYCAGVALNPPDPDQTPWLNDRCGGRHILTTVCRPGVGPR